MGFCRSTHAARGHGSSQICARQEGRSNHVKYSELRTAVDQEGYDARGNLAIAEQDVKRLEGETEALLAKHVSAQKEYGRLKKIRAELQSKRAELSSNLKDSKQKAFS